MAGRYDKEARFRFRGNPADAKKFMGEGRKYLGQMLETNIGLESAYRRFTTAQGVTFRLTKRMDDPPIIDIDVTGVVEEKQKADELMILAVAHYGDGDHPEEQGLITFINADTAEVLLVYDMKGIYGETRTPYIKCMIGAPHDPFVYVVAQVDFNECMFLRLDFTKLMQLEPPEDAVVGGWVLYAHVINLAISDDGERLYCFYPPYSVPFSEYTPGGYLTFSWRGDWEDISNAPTEMLGRFSGAVATPDRSRFYTIWNHDDANPATSLPGDSDEHDPDYGAYSVYVQDGTTPLGFLSAFPLFNFYHAWDNAYTCIAVNGAGTRLYLAGQIDEVGGGYGQPNEFPPLLYCINIEDDANTIIHARNVNFDPRLADLTGEIVVSHDDKYAYVLGKSDYLARMIDLENDACYIDEVFPFRPPGISEPGHGSQSLSTNRSGFRLRMGQKGGLSPDNRVYMMSWNMATIWVFDVGNTEPSIKLNASPDGPIPYWGDNFAVFKQVIKPVEPTPEEPPEEPPP